MRKVMKSYGILKAEKSMYPAVVMQTNNTLLFFSDQSYNSYRYLNCYYHISVFFWGGGGWRSSPQILLALLASVWSKNKGGWAPRAPSLDLPLCNNLVILNRGSVTGWSGCQHCNWVILALTVSWGYILSSSDP